MGNGREYRFTIDASYSLETLPMALLAEFMADLAKLLGQTEAVHFVKLDRGSIQLVHRVDDPAVPAVDERLARVIAGDAPPQAMDAYRSIDKRLRKTNSVGSLTAEGRGQVIQFPGRTAAKPISFGIVVQEGSLDGQIIKIGGRKSTAHIELRADSTIYKCVSSLKLARKLGRHIYGKEIRLIGKGYWHRSRSGDWSVVRFKASGFEKLSDVPLTEVVKELREIPGNKWTELKDPWKELNDLRNETG